MWQTNALWRIKLAADETSEDLPALNLSIIKRLTLIMKHSYWIIDNAKQVPLHICQTDSLLSVHAESWSVTDPFFLVALGETAGFKHSFSFSAEANDYSKPWTVAQGSSGIQDWLTLTSWQQMNLIDSWKHHWSQPWHYQKGSKTGKREAVGSLKCTGSLLLSVESQQRESFQSKSQWRIFKL